MSYASLDSMEYEELPEESPEHLKMSVDLEKYIEEKGLEEYSEEIMQFEEDLLEAADHQKFATSPVVALAAAYRAATGERYQTVAEKFEVPRGLGEQVRGVYQKLGFDEKELFDEPVFRKEQRKEDSQGSINTEEVAIGLHSELEPEMDREDVAEIYNNITQ